MEVKKELELKRSEVMRLQLEARQSSTLSGGHMSEARAEIEALQTRLRAQESRLRELQDMEVRAMRAVRCCGETTSCTTLVAGQSILLAPLYSRHRRSNRCSVWNNSCWTCATPRSWQDTPVAAASQPMTSANSGAWSTKTNSCARCAPVLCFSIVCGSAGHALYVQRRLFFFFPANIT